MFTVHGDRLRRAVRSLAAVWIVAAFWGGSALQSKAQTNVGTIGFSATNYNVLASDGSVTIPVWSTNGVGDYATVQYRSLNGTALSGNDFLFTSGALSFPPGALSNGFTVSIIKHPTPQPTKYFLLSLSSPSGAALDTNVPPLLPSNIVVTIIGNQVTNSPTLVATQNGSELVLSWSGVWLLQTAPDLSGPWSDLPAASSPFTIQIGSQPAAFFRLR